MAEHTNFDPDSVESENVEEVPVTEEHVTQPDAAAGAKKEPPVDPIDEQDQGALRFRCGHDRGRQLVILNFGAEGIRTAGFSPAAARHFAAILNANADAIDPKSAIPVDGPAAE